MAFTPFLISGGLMSKGRESRRHYLARITRARTNSTVGQCPVIRSRRCGAERGGTGVQELSAVVAMQPGGGRQSDPIFLGFSTAIRREVTQLCLGRRLFVHVLDESRDAV